MKVSIVIPVYNVASCIEKCLHSVLEQSYRNLEVILVDDCGTDDSMTLAENYLSQHAFSNIKIVRHHCNCGLSAARNSGLKVAQGEYVYFLDSDDEITSDCIEKLVSPLKKTKYDFVIAGYKVVGSDKQYPSLILQEGAVIENKNILHAYSEGLWYMMAWNKLCNKEFLLRNALFFEEGLLHEDVVWSFKLACLAESMYVIKEDTYLYYIRQSSIMTSMTIEKDVRTYIDVFKVMGCFIKERHRVYEEDEYRILEGRKSTLLFSLLQTGEYKLYKKYYPIIYGMKYLSPLRAFAHKVIGLKYLFRDFHYCLPCGLGCFYKVMFYNICYRWRGKKIDGALL